MLVALDDDELVALGVLRGHVPRVLGPVRGAADVEAVPLAERVVGEAAMPAALLSRVVANDAGALGQVLAQELRERPLADETDARAVLLLGDGEPGLARDLAHLALRQLAERHQHVDEVGGSDGVQKVALVLGRIDGLAQPRHAAGGPRRRARSDPSRCASRRAAARSGA